MLPDNKVTTGYERRDLMGNVASQNPSQSLFGQENVNTIAAYNNESNKLSAHNEHDFYNNSRNEIPDNSWTRGTSFGSIRSLDEKNGLKSPGQGVNTQLSMMPHSSSNRSLHERTLHHNLQVTGNLDSRYPVDNVDNSLRNHDASGSWISGKESAESLPRYGTQTNNYQIRNELPPSFQNNSYNVKQDMSLNNGFANRNQSLSHYGASESEQYAPNGFSSIQQNQPRLNQHSNVQYQQKMQPSSGMMHMQKHHTQNVGHVKSKSQQLPEGTIPLPPNFNPQQQVFYMAVPMQNGSGQMLQPVQMVNLGNGQSTFVVANNAPVSNAVNTNIPHARVENNNMSSFPQYANGYDNINGAKNQNPNYSHHSHDRGSISSPSLGSANKKKDKRNKGKGNGANKQQGQNYATNGGNNGQYSNGSAKSDLVVDDYPVQKSYESNGSVQLPPVANNSTNSSDTITALYHSTHRPPLSSLLGHVRRLSRDQVGCRLLQQSLDEDGPHAATAILNEGLPFLTEAMTDPFGNYLFQKILEKITSEERLLLVRTVGPRLVNAALNLHGTRSVQKVVEMSALDDNNLNLRPEEKSVADIVTSALAPAAARLCIDSHGNHVIQRILQKLPHNHSKFVFDAVAQSVGDVARHRHGCCVIQRCLDSPPSPARSNLVKRIVEKSLDLMQDAYGNYVVQYVLDVCGDDEAGAVCESVVGKIGLLAIQKFSSNVMEKCLERSNDRVRELHLNELSSPDKIRELMIDPFGNYVVQKALSVATHSQAVRLVEAMRHHLPGMRNTAGGRRIVAKISRRFPRFDPSAGMNVDVNNIGLNLSVDGNGRNNIVDNQQSYAMHHQHHVNYPHPITVGYLSSPDPGLAVMKHGGLPIGGQGNNDHHHARN